MLTEDALFKTRDQARIWYKYCGFLDLSLTEFVEIQGQLLMEQIELVFDSPLAKKFMTKKPRDISEFRQLVPLTTFVDYATYLNDKNEDVLAVKPYLWARTSGRGGIPKLVPYTERAMERLATCSIAMMILSCTTRKGEVNIGIGTRLLHNMPPPPYLTGILAQVVPQVLGISIIPPLDKFEDAEFEERIRAGFEIALRSGADMLCSLASVLVKMGDSFAERSAQMKFNLRMLHPQIMLRLIRAWLRSKREGRVLLPKDLWSLKGLSCYGTDASIYREQIIYYWGKEPFEIYGATEVGLIAMHAWNKKSMTFTPFTCFLEFVPEEEWLRSVENKDYQPSTILLDEVKPGERYEIIVTSFHGMPFLRYRVGDLIKVVGLEDEEAGIKIPQIVFESRADDLIDMAGFARFDEKTTWQAIANTEIKYEDWSARKEYEQNVPILRLYIELKEDIEAKKVEELIHRQMLAIHQDYSELESMLGIRPLKVSILPAGSFQRYYEKKKRGGADLAHLKPPHMNASNSVIQDLLGLAENTHKK